MLITQTPLSPLTQSDGQLSPSSLFAFLSHYHRRRLQHTWMTKSIAPSLRSVDRSLPVACPWTEFSSTTLSRYYLHVWHYQVLYFLSLARCVILSGVAVNRHQPQHNTLAIRLRCSCCLLYVCSVGIGMDGATHTDGTAVQATHSCSGDGDGGDVGGGGGDARASEKGRDGVRVRRPVRLAIERLRTEESDAIINGRNATAATAAAVAAIVVDTAVGLGSRQRHGGGGAPAASAARAGDTPHGANSLRAGRRSGQPHRIMVFVSFFRKQPAAKMIYVRD